MVWPHILYDVASRECGIASHILDCSAVTMLANAICYSVVRGALSASAFCWLVSVLSYSVSLRSYYPDTQVDFTYT